MAHLRPVTCRGGATAAAAAAPVRRPAPGGLTTVGTARTYTVRSGDTLAKIASAQGVAGGWEGLWALNRDTVAEPQRDPGGSAARDLTAG